MSFMTKVESELTPQGNWEDKVSQGNGWSYGAELFLQKQVGNLTGWIGYTLSWSYRQFDDISNGEAFPYRYDRRHDFAITLNYKINERMNASLNWVFATGISTTLAVAQYIPTTTNFYDALIENGYSSSSNDYGYSDYGNSVKSFGSRNGYKYPPTHRLDLGFNIKKKKKRGVRTWSYGIYNAYSRVNPYYVEYETWYEDNKRHLVAYGLFPIIPSISYKFEF